ncbi:DUF2125 domain-containing protein [Falsihalocynthiibacter sp. SS001]|uniref:DUF2125 domain-containing protein n=1 Tax=Falsihalocynthiibacter sp. SS001 TaxID=3349698 RepID=UPI0036D43212
MRILFWLLVIVSILWGGYWFIGSSAVEREAKAALANASEDGYALQYSELKTIGFPSRFDTTISDVDFTAPSGLRWTAPFFQVFALSYKPYHLIAVWPNEQTISDFANTVELTSEDLRASLIVEPNTKLALDRLQLTGLGLEANINNSDNVTVQDLSVATRQGIAAQSHDIFVSLNDLHVSSPQLPRGQIAFDAATLDANVVFDQPLNRESERPEVLKIMLNNANVSQGDVRLGVSGELNFDAAGRANGSLTLKAENWRTAFDQLRSLGVLPEKNAEQLQGLLSALANSSGSETDITAPLAVKNGAVLFGFIPLGQIPPL